MKSAIILHGTQGAPDNNWFKWLEVELQSRGLEVWLPQLPRPELPSLRLSTDLILDNCPFPIDADTLMVGHSSGAIVALTVAQENKGSVGAIVGVSVFHDNSLGWAPNNELFDMAFDWPAIRRNAKRILFVHSDNDPYVPLEKAKYVADNCQAELVVMKGEGHFNLEKSGEYKVFPKLVELMERRDFI